MKSIEEFRKELSDLQDETYALYNQKYDINEQIASKESSIKSIKSIIANYETEQKRDEERQFYLKFLKWLTGGTEDYNVGDYNGVICPSFNIFEYKGEMPFGTNEEVIALMKEKGCELVTFSTNFIPGGLWGDEVISIKFHKKV